MCLHVLKALDALRSAFFAVKGHADSKGSEAYNRALSLRRADAVKNRLSQERGLSPDRLVVAGLGEGFPIAGLSPDDGRNRRVEIVNLGATPLAVDPAESQRPARAKRALLIGIDDYRQVSRLEGPVNDAIEMKSFLVDGLQYAQSDIKLLINEDATRANILASIDDWLIAPTASEDEIFLFFSGYGFQQPDDNNDEADALDETWVPVDAVVEVGDEGSYSTRGMITDDDIDNRLQSLAGKQVYVVIDSCQHSLSRNFPALAAFGFGLLHGLGFAGALAEIGLPENSRLPALLFFNIGIELGQLAIIAAVLLSLAALRLKFNRFLYETPIYLTGGIASFWFMERSLQILI